MNNLEYLCSELVEIQDDITDLEMFSFMDKLLLDYEHKKEINGSLSERCSAKKLRKMVVLNTADLICGIRLACNRLSVFTDNIPAKVVSLDSKVKSNINHIA